MPTPLQNVPFRYLWAAHMTSGCGAQISRMAVILFLFHHENDIRGIAVFVVAATLPGVMTAVLAGAVIDRSNKRTVMLLAECIRIGAGAMILAWPQTTMIYVAAVLSSVASAFFEPSRAACVPLLVERPGRSAANGFDQILTGIVLLAGPIAGANIFLATGLTGAVTVDLAMRTITLLFLFALPASRLEPGERTSENTIAAIRDGWTYIATHGTSMYAVLLVAVSIFCVTLWIPIAPLHLHQLFADADRILSIHTGLFGIGALLGGFAAPRVLRWAGSGAAFFCGLALEAIALTSYSQVRTMPLSMAVCLVWGICVSLTLVAYYVLIQELVGSDFLGRVLAFAQQGEGVATVASMALAAVLFQLMSAQRILFFAGIVYLAIVSFSAATRTGMQLLRTR